MYQPRVLSIQDISCFGKCSLTVALPIISAMGVETAILPTAILSTHTGGFTGYTFRDLTSDINPIINHWGKEKITFNGIYTGYLGSIEQIELVKDIFNRFGKNAFKLVDPVMGDNGCLYKGFGIDFPSKMLDLCRKADIIVPNMTEACLMTGDEYRKDASIDYVKKIILKLSSLGCKNVIMTGFQPDGEREGIIGYSSDLDEFFEYYTVHINERFHGTGDVFSSSFCGALALGKSVSEASRIAVEYTVDCIKKSYGDDEHKYGVRFEESIPYLVILTENGLEK